MTRYSRRIIECGATLLQDRYGNDRCSFLTLTIPPSDASWTIEGVNKAYNRFQTALLRQLARKGLPPFVIGCLEAHPERSAREGRLVPHYHLVFVGRKRYQGWGIDKDWFRDTWVDCLEQTGCVSEGCDRRAATSVERVKKSVAAYMGKYLTDAKKFSGELSETQLENETPGSWHKVSRKMLTLIKSSVKVRRGRQAERLLEILRSDLSGNVLFVTSVRIDRCGENWWVGEYMRICRKSIKFFLSLSGEPFHAD